MSEASSAPRWFTPVAVLAVIWNLFGVLAYIGHVTLSPEALAAMPEAERALIESTPAWANGAFAIAVWAGVAGSILLLLRKSAAFVVLVTSFAGVLVQQVHTFGMSDALAVQGNAVLGMAGSIFVIALLLVVLAQRAKSAGWLA